MNEQVEIAYQQIDKLTKDLNRENNKHIDGISYDHLLKKFDAASLIIKRYTKMCLFRALSTSALLTFNVYAVGFGCRVFIEEKCYLLLFSTLFNVLVALVLGRLSYLQWTCYRSANDNYRFIKQLKISFTYGDDRRTGK